MLKQLVNECQIDFNIKIEGPVLIKSGIETGSGPDMAFVTVFRNGAQEVYLPGSSLKGMLRAHAERITRTLAPENSTVVCDPFKTEPKCGSNGKDNPEVYKKSCLICKLFGSTSFASRLATEDAYSDGRAPAPQQRDGVGIDRFTGGAADRAKFNLEVISEGVFATALHIRNFELWQLGLIGFVLQDLKDGFIRIGFGKSRGLGKVSAEIKRVRLHFLGPNAPQPNDDKLPIRGVGSLFQEAESYGMVTPDETAIEFAHGPQSNGVRTTATFPNDTFPWQEVASRWVERVKSYATTQEGQRHREDAQR